MSDQASSTLQVVDPHVHLWDRRAVEYPWLDDAKVAYSGDNRLLPITHDVSKLLRDAGDIEILATVNIESNPADPILEAEWLQEIAHRSESLGHPHGIVAYADLSRSDVPRALERLAENKNMRGIRQILNVHPDSRYNYVDRHYLADSRWRQNLRLLKGYGWSFDLQIYPAQAAAAVEIIQENPDTRFILNHTGMCVDRADTHCRREWQQALRLLAACDNTAIKLSGLAMFDHNWTTDSFRLSVLEAIDCFGASRCMFASNFPIDGLHATYTMLWKAYAQIVSAMSVSERQGLFVHNATRYYRLPAISLRKAYELPDGD